VLYLRTASGDFINAADIIELSPKRDDDSEEIIGWIATCADGKAVLLGAYYAQPGRLEQAIRFMPAVETRAADYPAN
jgi:hypothetical protein